MSTSLPVLEYPPSFLPGLKLKIVEEKTEEATTALGSLSPTPSDVFICIKHFNSAFKLFPAQDPSLAVTYVGGIKDVPEQINGEAIDFYESLLPDKDSEDEEYDEKGNVKASSSEEVDNEDRDANHVDIVSKVYEKVKSEVDGYFCFHLRVEEDWASEAMTKALETIEVSVAVHDGEDPDREEKGEPKKQQGAMVGETFVIDVSDHDKDQSGGPKMIFLDWDLSNLHMRQVFSPAEIRAFDNEKKVPQDILFLGAADNKMYNPMEPLSLHVNMFGVEDPEDLRIEIFSGVEVDLNMKKSVTDALEDAAKAATAKLDIGKPVISTKEGWVTFEFGVENVLKAFLANYSDKFPGLITMGMQDFNRILDPDARDKTEEDEKIMDVISSIIASVRLSVVVKNEKGEHMAKFLLDALESNDMFYDSAVMVLKDRSNWTEEKLIKWSTMAAFSSLTDFNCIYRFAQYKLTEKDSVSMPHVERQHAFHVTVDLPKMQVDPNDLRLLVHHTDDNLIFANDDASTRFKYLPGPDLVTIGPDGSASVIFQWNVRDQAGLTRDTDVNITLLVSPSIQGTDPDYDGDKKIGSTSSFSKKLIGHESKTHFLSMKMRNAIALGVEDVSTVEESVSNFLESLFRLVFKISGLDSDVSRSQLEHAADEVAQGFYKEMVDEKAATLYEEIMKSSVLYSDEQQNDESVAKFLMNMLGGLLEAYSGDLGEVINILLEEKGFREGDAQYQAEFEHFRLKFLAVFEMKPLELSDELAKYPSAKETFISNCRVLSDEIVNANDSDVSTDVPNLDSYSAKMGPSSSSRGRRDLDQAFEVLSASGMNIAKEDFVQVISDPIQSLEIRSRRVSREIFNAPSSEEFAPAMMSIRSIDLMSMGAKLDEKLITMLNDATGSSDSVTAVFDSVQDAMQGVLSPLDALDSFMSTTRDLTSNAKSLERAIGFLIPMIIRIGSRCPLWPVKALVNIMKNPLTLLKNAAKNGKNSIVRVNDKMSKSLKNVVNQRTKIRNTSTKFDKPKGAIEKFQEVMGTISILAAAGLVPVDLITKFINASTLKDFFNTLTSNINQVKDVFNGLNREIAKLTRYLPSVKSLLSSIRTKFNVIKPIDNLFRKLSPWVDKAVSLFRRSFGWWTRWLFKVLLKPIEWTVNFLLRPFKSAIKRMVERINPFGGTNYLYYIEHYYIGGISSSARALGKKLSFVDSLSGSAAFEKIANTLADGIAIALRAIYGLLSTTISNAAGSMEILEQLLHGSDAMSKLTEILKIEKGFDRSVTMSSILLNIKAQSIDGQSSQVDSYLQNRVGSHPYYYVESYTENKIRQFIGDYSYYNRQYEFVPCYLDPQSDASSPFFERASQSSWLTAPLAAILHHKLLVKNVKAFSGDTVDYNMFSDGFIPQISNGGQCRIQLFSSFDSTHTTSYTVDTRLPVKKASLQLPPDVSEMPAHLMQFVYGKVFAFTNECFSLAQRGSGSWAMLEKVAICKLNVTKDSKELIGTGVHLLSGLKGGTRYSKRANGTWEMQKVSLAGKDFHVRSSHFSAVTGQENIPSDALMTHLTNRTLSNDQMDTLLQAESHREDGGLDNTTKTEIIQQMNNLSMFVVLSIDGIAHPIICHDTTEEKNPLYSPGTVLQPLTDLGGVKEIWEYSITSTDTSPFISLQQSRSIQLQSNDEHFQLQSNDEHSLLSIIRTDDYLTAGLVVGGLGLVAAIRIMVLNKVPPGLEQHKLMTKQLLREAFTRINGFTRKDKPQPGDIVTLDGQRTPLYIVHRVYQKRVYNQREKRNESVMHVEAKRIDNERIILQRPIDRVTIAPDAECQTKEVLRAKGVFKKNERRRPSPTNRAIYGTDTQYKWAMTFKQFRDYLHCCMGCKDGETLPSSTLWINLTQNIESTQPGRILPARKGYVNAHEMNDTFIIPNTVGTGMAVALNMQDRPDNGRAAKVLISHAWNEDMEQVLAMLEEAKGTRLSDGSKFGDDTVVWFCCFSNFQCNGNGNLTRDRKGVTLPAIMANDPFEKVLRSTYCTDMIVLQTSTYDPNSRFWCVIELYEALLKQEEQPGRFEVHYMFSRKFLNIYVKRPTLPSSRKWEKSSAPWGGKYVRLTDPNEAAGADEVVIDPWTQRMGPHKLHFQRTYKLFGENDAKIFTADDIYQLNSTWEGTWLRDMGVAVGVEWPYLRHMICMSHYQGCQWERKFYDISNEKWWQMQRTIASNQHRSALEAMRKFRESGNFSYLL